MRASLSARPAAAATARRASLICRADSVLIANTKGGGHAFLGLHLAKKLMSQGHKVTILNDGDEVRRRELKEGERSPLGAIERHGSNGVSKGGHTGWLG
jgi:hypothetical protein